MGYVGKCCFLSALLLFVRSGVGQTGSSASSQDSIADQPNRTSQQRSAVLEESYDWLAPGAESENRLISPFLKHLVQDQRQFWTTPTRLRVKDLKWIAPSAAVIGVFISTDSW